MKRLLPILALLALAVPAPAQSSRWQNLLAPFSSPNACPNGQCINGQCEQWRTVPGQPAQLALFRNGIHVGSWDMLRKEYRTYNAATREWGEPVFALTAEDGPAAAGNAGEVKTGMEWDKVGQGPQFKLGSTPITKEQAYEALNIQADSSIPRDKDRLYVGFIARDRAARDSFAKTFETAECLRPWRDRVRLKCQSPDDPMLKDRDNRPLWYQQQEGVYLVSANGLPLGVIQLPDYQGPEQIAEALFRVDPRFDPDQVPNLARPAEEEAALDILLPIGAGLFVAFLFGSLSVGGLGAYFYFRK
jgi:hypothetical protein